MKNIYVLADLLKITRVILTRFSNPVNDVLNIEVH